MKKKRIDYRGYDFYFWCVISQRISWTNNGPFDTIAEVWERIHIQKKKPYAVDHGVTTVYKQGLDDYTNIVHWFDNLPTEEQEQIYNQYQKETLFLNIKYSGELCQ